MAAHGCGGVCAASGGSTTGEMLVSVNKEVTGRFAAANAVEAVQRQEPENMSVPSVLVVHLGLVSGRPRKCLSESPGGPPFKSLNL